MSFFTYHAPTAIYSGRCCLEKMKATIADFGSRAFIITGKFSDGCPNLALEDIKRIYNELGVEYKVYDKVEENPSVESIEAIASSLLTFDPQYIFAIGGGSALDSAKAVNVLINFEPGSDAYKVFYGDKPCMGACSAGKLPMLAVPTTAGSGSDVMGFAILTRSDTNTKLRIDQLSFFSASFLDPDYISQSPEWLLEAGALDALAHGIEGVLNTHTNDLSRLWNNYGFRLFKSFKDNLAGRCLTSEDYSNMLLAASVQGVGNMQCCTTIPHGLGYSLTHFKGVSHGFANMLVMAEFLRTINDSAAVDEVLRQCGFLDIDDFDEYIQKILRRNVAFIVTDAELHAWAKECAALTPRLEAHIQPISEDEIYRILRVSLEDYMIHHL